MRACRAVTVRPGERGSARLEAVDVPEPGPGEVLVAVREVGVCGTDLEIDGGRVGEAAPGQERLVLGHESHVEVLAAGPGVTGWRPGQHAVAMVRRPCADRCPACAAGRPDFCTTGRFAERGIARLDGFLRERLVEQADFLVPVPAELAPLAVLVEPLSVVEKALTEAWGARAGLPWTPRRALVAGAGTIGLLAALVLLERGLEVWVLDRRPPGTPKGRFARDAGLHYLDDAQTPLETAVRDVRFDLAVEATGHAPLLFRAAALLARGGVLALVGVAGGRQASPVDADAFNNALVGGNRAVVGSVNAARAHYEAAVGDLGAWARRRPGLAERLITSRYPLERFRDALAKPPDDIKTVVEVSGPGPSHRGSE